MKIQFDPPPASAAISNGIPVKYDNVKRTVPRWRWFLVLGIVLLIPLYFAYRAVSSTVLRASPGMVVVDQMVMRAPITGQVETVAREGQAADEGASVVRVVQKQVPVPPAGSGQATGAVAASAEQSYAAQRRELQGQQAALQSSLQAARERVSLMQGRVRQMDELFRQGAATRQEVEGARMQVLQARTEMGSTQREILAANQQQSALLLQAAKDAAATRQTAGLTPAGNIAAVADLTAPVPSQVVRSFVKTGEWVVAGDELLVLQTRKAPWVQAYLKPQQLKYARKGQKATLVFLDGEKVPAEVEEVLSETQRIPPERVGPMEEQSAAVVVKLRPLQALSAEYRVNRLPIDVRFPESWWPWKT
ncbi:multidrug resistance efflux pump-like protein [Comamonas phosphati]|nr:multidrug resistance efflux pump-like protein [Comamonas phosphati]